MIILPPLPILITSPYVFPQDDARCSTPSSSHVDDQSGGGGGGPSWSRVSISHKVLSQVPDELMTCAALIQDVVDFDGEEDMLVK